MRQNLLQRLPFQPLPLQLRPRLLRRLPCHQRLGLCQKIRQQDLVVQTPCDGIVRFGRRKEVGWYQPGALMDQLVEGVLAVGAGFTPDDGAGAVIDFLSGAGNVLSVALHVTLLEVCGETVEVLVVGEESVGLRTEEVAVPDSQESQNYGSLENNCILITNINGSLFSIFSSTQAQKRLATLKTTMGLIDCDFCK